MDSRRNYIYVIVILMLGWGLWLQRMGVNDHDDAVSNELVFAQEPVTAIVAHNPWPDQSPVYFLVLHAARTFGESPFAVQLLNALLLTMTLVATYAVGQAFSGSASAAGAAVLLGAISPTSLWLVRNGRMYSIQVLVSVVAAVFVLRYLERRRPRDLVAFSLVSVLHIYTHFVGFLITAVLFLPLLTDGWPDTRQPARDDAGPPDEWRRRLLPQAVAIVGILILVLPQVVRLAGLVGANIPVRPGLSLPGLSRAFVERVTWFWFMNADWGPLRGGGRVITNVYAGSIAILAAAGLASAPRRIGVAAGLWILLPVLLLGLAAGRMDVRDRYLVWVVPLLWMAVANGAVGPLPFPRLAGTSREIAQGIRSALFLAVVTASLFLVWNKLPERYPQWTKLMLALKQVYRPPMVVYMPPGPPTATPRLLGSHLNLPAGLTRIIALNEATRPQFLAEVERGQEFIFLVHWTYDNAEFSWRTRYLVAHQYKKAVIPVWGARAEIFTHAELEGFSLDQHIEPHPTPDKIVGWTRQRFEEKLRPPSRAPRLAEALVARVDGDGAIREGRLFISQRGESGSWRLGPVDWDAVEEVHAASGGRERDMIAAHPVNNSVLVVAFPALQMKKSLSLEYGIADSGLRFPSGADVALAVYVNGTKRADAVCPNTPGWKNLTLDTAALQGARADVALLVTTANDQGRHFAFRLATSARAATAPPPRLDRPISSPVILTGGRTLSDSVYGLNVYRLAGATRIDARNEPHSYSASDMHEEEGPNGEGAVRQRWALGPPPWDEVGLTRQRSSDEARDGLWAHPRDSTTLVIEVPQVVTGSLLHGYFGVTDFSVTQAIRNRVAAPVQLKVFLDGQSAFAGEAPRTRGWHVFAVPTGGGTRARSLRIEIACAKDSWAHFVFDLWSD